MSEPLPFPSRDDPRSRRRCRHRWGAVAADWASLPTGYECRAYRCRDCGAFKTVTRRCP